MGMIVVFHAGAALLDKPIYRASHLGPALQYARGSIDLLRPIIVGFNATQTPTAQEFPLWQAAAGLAFKITHSTWYGWANIVSLLLFATGLLPFFQLARNYVQERALWWALVFFLAQPLIIVMAGKAATDGFCLVLTLWFLFFVEKMIRTGSGWWLLPAALFASLSAVSKLPFFMAAGLCSIAMLITNKVNNWRLWAYLAAVGAVATAVFAVWTRYTESLAAQAVYPYYELRLSKNPVLVSWFFGGPHVWLNVPAWIKGGWRFLHATLGSLPLAGLLIVALIRPGNRLPKLWLLSSILTTAVFTALVLDHWHYYLMFCPAVALLCGSAIAKMETFLCQEIPRCFIRLAIAAIVLIFSAIDGMIVMKVAIEFDYFPKQISLILKEHTAPQDKLIVSGEGGWGGEVLFRSERTGLSVYSLETLKGVSTSKGLYELLASETDLGRLKSLGYNKLVLLSESPVWWAVRAVNPGSQRKRILYPPTISPTVDAWPIVYQSEDILIKQIP
jgi:hypothetical protein